MKSSPPGRYLYVPVPTLMIRLAAIAPLLFVAAAVTGCFGWVSITYHSSQRFGSDPVCTRTISLGRAPAKGTSCEILRGTIDGARVVPGAFSDDSPTDHLDFSSGDRTFDVILENEGGSPVFSRAQYSPGEPAVLELFDGGAAFVATADGELSSQNDPQSGLAVALGFTAVLAVLSVFALAVSAAIFFLIRSKPGS